jgi:capsular exopolysaccharide synthesis family protein
MSRIHEALKRAEQDRAESAGIRVEVVEAPPPGPIPVEPVESVHIPSAALSPTVEMLLARCASRVWKPDSKTVLFLDEESGEYGREEFRTLRSRLYQIRESRPLKKLLIASALPEEGRSFVAANLAQTLARQQGCRVLLVDADFRRPALHVLLGTNVVPGLSEYLLGEADELGVMQRGSMDNLFFVPAGRTVASPAELAASRRFETFLNYVQPLFDWIVLDSPPAVPVSDASLLASQCDGVLMVARSNITSFDTLRRAGQEFREQQLVGVVLNGAKDGRAANPR